MPTESGNTSAVNSPGFLPSFFARASVPTWFSVTVNIAWIRRLSRMYGAIARPSSVPMISGRSFNPFHPRLPSGRGASVCIQ